MKGRLQTFVEANWQSLLAQKGFHFMSKLFQRAFLKFHLRHHQVVYFVNKLKKDTDIKKKKHLKLDKELLRVSAIIKVLGKSQCG